MEMESATVNYPTAFAAFYNPTVQRARRKDAIIPKRYVPATGAKYTVSGEEEVVR
jgi:hypothetical protein